MGTLQLELGQDLLDILQSLGHPVQRIARELIILELYREGLIAAGKAAEVSGVSLADFLRHASQVPYFVMIPQEWDEEVSESRKI